VLLHHECSQCFGKALLIGWQKRHLVHKKSHATNPEWFSSGISIWRKPRSEWLERHLRVPATRRGDCVYKGKVEAICFEVFWCLESWCYWMWFVVIVIVSSFHSEAWRSIQLRFYVLHDTNIGHFRDILCSQSRSMVLKILNLTRMWANAQRDGRPTEYRSHPVLNAAKFGSRPLLDCHAVTLPIGECKT